VRAIAVLALIASLGAASAPADKYFGKLHMSALRVRYETAQVKNRYEKHQLLPEQAEHLADLTKNAFDDWAKRYPHDTWLASTGSNLARLYAELPGASAARQAKTLYAYVKTHFPKTTYAKTSAAALHRGVPVRADPAWAMAMRAATPAPSPVPSSSAVPSPSPSPMSLPSPAPTL
jgi:hypothetical protein